MAKIYLDSTDIAFTITDGNSSIYGADNNQTITIGSNAKNVIIDQNIEKIVFSDFSINDYKYSQSGNQINVYKKDGTLIATAPLQGDANGSELQFADQTINATLKNGVMSMGSATLTSTPKVFTEIKETTGTTTPSSSVALDSSASSKSKVNTTYDSSSFLTTDNNIIQSLNSSIVNPYQKWTSSNLGYSFNSSMPSEYTGNNARGWEPVKVEVQEVADSIMVTVDNIIAPKISKLAPGTGEIRFNVVDSNYSYAYFPSEYYSTGGDVFLSKTLEQSVTDSFNLSEISYFSVTHELGHALGLKHPFEDGVTLTSGNNRVNTVMSYTDSKTISVSLGDTYNSADWITPKGFMVYDIAALQYIYGADTTTAIEDTTYTFDKPFYESIWDAGGNDTINLSTTTFSNKIDLKSGNYSDVNYLDLNILISTQQKVHQDKYDSNAFDDSIAKSLNTYVSDLAKTGLELYTGEKALGIAYGAVIENAIGGSANDTFYDNSVNNSLVGNAGDDIFYLGTGGYDTVNGGNGSDKIVLSVNKADTQMELKESGVTLLVASTFAISLTGVETIQFADQVLVV